MKVGKTEIAEIAAVALAVIAVAALVFLPGTEAEPEPPANPKTVLICIDSTVSTDDVRDTYEVDLEKVVRQAAFHQDHLLAAACGANATAEVAWPVSRWFQAERSKERYAREELEYQIDVVMEGNEEKEGIGDLLKTRSKETTPVGEMLAVTARQCEQEGGDCRIYFFTDGEWADSRLRIKGGISEQERSRYLRVYDSELDGLAGSTVNFIGVGLKTEMKEPRLDEARSVARELIEQAGGKMGDWTARS